ncbi:MAG: RecX family transcriptional regulator [Firmicutes bacterium]|nr:RecX family transcriptional regulator [Bacillota bacterium]
MPRITSLEVQKTNKDRINVYVEGEFFCGISLDTAVKYSITRDKECTDEDLAKLLKASGENDLYGRAINYILRSPRTEREITQYLFRKDASPETVKRIVNRLKTSSYINDEAYAQMFAEQKSGKLGAGNIRNKLYMRGVDTELIEQALGLVEGETQEELAKKIAEKYLRSKGRDDKSMQKLYRYLGSKGFDFDLINRIIEDAKRESEINPEKVEEYQSKYKQFRQAKEEMKARKRELKDELKKLREQIKPVE